MIKYLKNLATSCPPQIEEVPVRNSTPVTKGAVCEYDGQGYVENSNSNDFATKFLMLESKKAGDGKTKLKAIRLLAGMVIEAPIYVDPETPLTAYVGSNANFFSENFDNYINVKVGNGSLSIASISEDGKFAVCVVKNA